MKKNNHNYAVSMNETFNLLEKRLIEANLNIDDSKLKNALNKITGDTITIGCGGSLVVANYLAKVLMNKGIFSMSINARDIMHVNFNCENIFAISYSGKTHGIHLALDRFKGNNKYLITCNNNVNSISNVENIMLRYENMDKEKSFISLSSTLIPIGEFLKVGEAIPKDIFSIYLKNGINSAKQWAYEELELDTNNDIFEIMTGIDTNTVSIFLESTMVESGLGIPIIHDKYDYCHGRSTTAYKHKNKHSLIYLINEKTEIDEFLLSIIKDNYNKVILIESDLEGTSLEKEYYLLLKTLYFCKRLAEEKKMDISQVEYDRDIVSKVYHYKGEM